MHRHSNFGARMKGTQLPTLGTLKYYQKAKCSALGRKQEELNSALTSSIPTFLAYSPEISYYPLR